MGFYFGDKSRERLKGVDGDLVRVLELGLCHSKIDFGIPKYGGVRSVEEQMGLFEDGKSKADGLKNKSKHQLGLAADVFAYVDGKASWEEEHLTHIASAILQAAGLWKSFTDMPHFEVKK
jgi:hypothetical protein